MIRMTYFSQYDSVRNGKVLDIAIDQEDQTKFHPPVLAQYGNFSFWLLIFSSLSSILASIIVVLHYWSLLLAPKVTSHQTWW